MFAQPSQSSETYTRYRDDADSGRDSEGNDVEQSAERSASLTSAAGSASAPATSENQRLLQEVLGETLIRNQENSDQLVQVLREFQRQHRRHDFDEALFVLIARQVLRHRLGDRAGKLPVDLFNEIGRALWSNQDSRERVRRFWSSLGAAK